jgi:hypothetical protein
VNAPLKTADPPEFTRREIDYLIGLASDTEKHFARSFAHLVKLRRKQILLILDNVDQREAPDQNAIFLVAEMMAKT